MTNIDPYFCRFKGIGYPNNYRRIELPAGFSIYMLCDTSDERFIFVHTDRKEFNLSSKKDDEDVIRLFENFSKRLTLCEKANDLFEHYDSKELHEGHRTKLKGHDVIIYRIQKANLRLYIVFLGPDIVLFRLSPKRQNKISESEKNILNNRVEAIYLHPVNSKDFLRRVL